MTALDRQGFLVDPSQNGTTVYTKLAFRDFLRQKYQSLGALNAAWGSTYTSWDSRSTSPSYTHTWSSACFRGPTKAIGFNGNWSGGCAPQDQEWYIDGIKADAARVGDPQDL